MRGRARLGKAAFAVAWNEGHAMPVEQAIAYALDEDRAIPSSNRSR
jgi:hypothetical protein